MCRDDLREDFFILLSIDPSLNITTMNRTPMMIAKGPKTESFHQLWYMSPTCCREIKPNPITISPRTTNMMRLSRLFRSGLNIRPQRSRTLSTIRQRTSPSAPAPCQYFPSKLHTKCGRAPSCRSLLPRRLPHVPGAAIRLQCRPLS